MTEHGYTLTFPSRQCALRAWLAGTGISKKDFAKALGIHPTRITRILSSDSAPARVVLKMYELGVPGALLPAPSKRQGRPKTRSEVPGAEHA